MYLLEDSKSAELQSEQDCDASMMWRPVQGCTLPLSWDSDRVKALGENKSSEEISLLTHHRHEPSVIQLNADVKNNTDQHETASF